MQGSPSVAPRARAAGTEVFAVIRCITEAADEAIARCKERIDVRDGIAHVTRDFPVTTPGDKQSHRRTFKGDLVDDAKR